MPVVPIETVPPAELLRRFFVDRGLVSGANKPPAGQWGAKVGDMPKDGNRWVSLLDTGSFLDGRIARTGSYVEYPTVQARIRAPDYPTGRAFGRLLVAAVGEVRPDDPFLTTEGDVEIYLNAVYLTSSLAKIATEEQGQNQVFSVNFRLSVGERAVPTAFSPAFSPAFG